LRVWSMQEFRNPVVEFCTPVALLKDNPSQ
jgi:hypothetical protein